MCAEPRCFCVVSKVQLPDGGIVLGWVVSVAPVELHSSCFVSCFDSVGKRVARLFRISTWIIKIHLQQQHRPMQQQQHHLQQQQHPPQPQQYRPSPVPGSFECCLLSQCDYRVTTCYGCGNPLKHSGHVPQAPNDLVLVSNMRREYRVAGEKRRSKLSNVYFHFRVKCVREKQPAFIPSLVHISPFVAQCLNNSHRQLIGSELGIAL